MSNRGVVDVAGREVPVVGRVCMDHVMVDATDVDLAQGDSVVLWGSENLPTEEVAQRIDTISYELVTRVGPRVKRVYVETDDGD
jgi:alanine racemase